MKNKNINIMEDFNQLRQSIELNLERLDKAVNDLREILKKEGSSFEAGELTCLLQIGIEDLKLDLDNLQKQNTKEPVKETNNPYLKGVRDYLNKYNVNSTINYIDNYISKKKDNKDDFFDKWAKKYGMEVQGKDEVIGKYDKILYQSSNVTVYDTHDDPNKFKYIITEIDEGHDVSDYVKLILMIYDGPYIEVPKKDRTILVYLTEDNYNSLKNEIVGENSSLQEQNIDYIIVHYDDEIGKVTIRPIK